MRLLLVEADPAVAGALAEELRGRGYGVDLVRTGGQLLGGPLLADLVLLDLDLPDLDGLEVCRRLRARSGVPVIALSGRDSELDRVLGFQAGLDDYVTRPVQVAELVARIVAVTRRVRGQAGEQDPPAPDTIVREPLRRDTTQKRRSIVTGALSVFGRVGYLGASIEMIAAEAGVSTRTIYNHFENKKELFVTVLMESSTRVAATREALIERHLDHVTDLEASLIALAKEWVRPSPDFADHFRIVRRLRVEAERFPPEMVRSWQEAGPLRARRALATRMAELATRGLLAAGDPEVAAQQFHGARDRHDGQPGGVQRERAGIGDRPHRPGRGAHVPVRVPAQEGMSHLVDHPGLDRGESQCGAGRSISASSAGRGPPRGTHGPPRAVHARRWSAASWPAPPGGRVVEGHDVPGRPVVVGDLGAGLPRPQHIEADAADHSGQPTREVVDDGGVLAGQPQPGVLDNVLGVVVRSSTCTGRSPRAASTRTPSTGSTARSRNPRQDLGLSPAPRTRMPAVTRLVGRSR
ncbi:hypothetical protein Acsp05_07510 [Actinokineospora sp. NBRC 105648]|nr:hypothetical protein Acsp05_07510 [Actinokineospora sp. NBRC 105648]